MSIVALLGLLHLLIAWRVVPHLPGPAAQVAFSLLLLASAVLIPAGFSRSRGHDRRLADRWSMAGMLALGLFSMLLVATLLREAVLLAAWAFHGPATASVPATAAATAATTTTLLTATATAVPLLALAGCLYGWAAARRTARVRRVDVPIEGLAPALDGFTIVQISDVHIGPTVKRAYLQAVADRVNTLKADAVAVTGDLVDGRVHDLRHDVAPLAELQSRHGTFFVTGNHEYYSGVREWTALLRTMGLRVLNNEHVLLTHGSARLVMAGVSDFSAHHFDPADRSDPRRALEGAPDAVLRVLLAHQPRSAPAAADAGFDLQLSGHTHGGQFWPWNLLVPLQQPFVAGLHRLGRLWVYTSRGTGYWGPPLRLGAPSEITQLRLVAAPPLSASPAR